MTAFHTPNGVAVGDMSYEANMETNSTLIKSMVHEFGPVGALGSLGRSSSLDAPNRVKRLSEEHQGKAATTSLDEKSLPFWPTSKLFLQLVTSIYFKVITQLFTVIEECSNS